MPLRPDQYLFTGREPDDPAAVVEKYVDLPPDVVIEVGHRHCGDLDCVRPDGPVTCAVSWLDTPPGQPKYKAVFDDNGFKICRQTLKRTVRKIEEMMDQLGK